MLKQQLCQLCQATETLNRHSLLYGNDPTQANGRLCRGQRVFCSDRGQRGGCGRTYAIFLAEVLPRHSVSAVWLWKLLCALLKKSSVRAAAQALRLPFGLETLYHLLARLRLHLDEVRSVLFRQQKPPDSSSSDPLVQTAEHLQSVFAKSSCPIQEFQAHLQRPFLA